MVHPAGQALTVVQANGHTGTEDCGDPARFRANVQLTRQKIYSRPSLRPVRIRGFNHRHWRRNTRLEIGYSHHNSSDQALPSSVWNTTLRPWMPPTSL